MKYISDLYHFIYFLLSYQDFIEIFFHFSKNEWRMRIFNLDIEYIHISHLKSFPIPVEIQNWFYNISFIFTTLHFRKSFKFSQ